MIESECRRYVVAHAGDEVQKSFVRFFELVFVARAHDECTLRVRCRAWVSVRVRRVVRREFDV